MVERNQPELSPEGTRYRGPKERLRALPGSVWELLKIIAIPAALSLSILLPDKIVSFANVTTPLMILTDEETTELLQELFERCYKENWRCDTLDPREWQSRSSIYISKVEDFFNRRWILHKSIGKLFRPGYIRASLYATLSGQVKECNTKINMQLNRVVNGNSGGQEQYYHKFIEEFNVAYGRECGFLYNAFDYSVHKEELPPSELYRAVNRRIGAIKNLTETLRFRADSYIHDMRTDIGHIKSKTLEGLSDICDSAAGITQRQSELDGRVNNIDAAIYGLREIKTNNREPRAGRRRRLQGRY
jgi:hypothetical protein